VEKEIIKGWNINPDNFQITFYNVDHCRSQLGDLKPYVLVSTVPKDDYLTTS